MKYFQRLNGYNLLAKALTDVLLGAHDGDVSATVHGGLEEGIHRSLPSGDILLVVRRVVRKALPPVLLSLLRFIEIGCHDFERTRRHLPMARTGTHRLLQTASKEGRARG